MKKWCILAVVLMMVAGVQAKEKKNKGVSDGPITQATFIETQKKKAETAGIAFEQAKAEAAFAAQDKDGDGVLTADEITPVGKHAKRRKSK